MSMLEKVKLYAHVYDATDVRVVLHEDHKEIRDLIDTMAGDEGVQTRVSAFRRLKPLLTAHARAEEAAVYTAMIDLKGSPDSREAGNEGFVEHSLVDVLLERLAKTQLAGTDAWKAHAKVLKELLEHHIDEEEAELFVEVGEHFTDEQRERMAANFTARKEALLAKAAGKRGGATSKPRAPTSSGAPAAR
jgi:hemerythrin superfamily protein